jgi:beta-lactam-binding protein with PASTA domain
MHISRSVAGIAVLLAAVSACGPVSDSKSGSSPKSSPSSAKSTAASASVPDFVGMGLQSAQDKAQELGFYGLDSHDSLGRGRNQLWDRDWRVCFQSPAAGKRVGTDTRIDFGTVKLKETCPAKDASGAVKAGGSMPDFRGRSVKAARAALDSSTSLTVDDASGKDRFIVVESNWQVCSQSPAAGTKLFGQPVTFKAVKFGESCP